MVVLVLGTTVFGSQRWVRIGPLTIQPSELAKLALVLALAKLFSEHENARDLRQVARAFLMTFILAGLILRQPDLGTAAIFICLLFTLWFVSDAKPKHILVAGSSLVFLAVVAIVVSFMGWVNIIKPYQLNGCSFSSILCGPHRSWLEYYPIHDSYWLRRLFGQGAPEWNPKFTALSTGQSH